MNLKMRDAFPHIPWAPGLKFIPETPLENVKNAMSFNYHQGAGDLPRGRYLRSIEVIAGTMYALSDFGGDLRPEEFPEFSRLH